MRSPVESAFAVHELHDGHRAQVGDLTLTTRSVDHGLPAFAVRVEAGGRSLVYSGDTAPCANLTSLADGCDVLLCEADGASDVHHTPEQAGDSAAGAGRLVLTHVGRSLTPVQAVERASGGYDGPIEYASPDRRLSW